MSSYISTPLWAFMACSRVKFTFTFTVPRYLVPPLGGNIYNKVDTIAAVRGTKNTRDREDRSCNKWARL